jgi:hypothetical protein
VRLHEISAEGDWPFVLELHDRLTVVTGLVATRQRLLAGVLNSVLRGEDAVVQARFELDGESFALDELVELGDESLKAAEPVIWPEDLRRLGRPPEGADQDLLAKAEHAVAVATEELDAAEAAASQTGEERIAGAVSRLALVEESRAEARRAVDAAQKADADRARTAASLQQALAAADAAVLAAERQRDAVRVRLAAAEADEAGPKDAEGLGAVSAALAAVERAPDAVRRQQASEVLARVESADRPPAQLLASARANLEAARLEAARAEESAKGFILSPNDAADLDRAYRDVIEAEERASRRLSSPLARRRVKAANEVLQSVLDRIGAPSYSAYLLRAVEVQAGSEAARQLERSRRELADAQARWDQLNETFGPLGLEDEGALRSLVEEHDSAMDALVSALDRYGIEHHGADARETATAWLAPPAVLVDGVSALVEQAERQLEEAVIARQLAEAEMLNFAGQAAVSDVGRLREELQQREREFATAEADVAAARAGLEAAEEAARRRVSEARASVDLAEAHRSVAYQLADVSDRDLEIYVLSRLAVLRSVGVLGAVPLVIVEPFSGLGVDQTTQLLSLIERMSEAVQVICLTESEAAVAWVQGLGGARGAVRRLASTLP